ncbi:MAG: MarR family winged helix-turn-helix transcriptional regulator [Candidatus Acidiferrales bacterium]
MKTARRTPQRDKTLRAWGAYLELTETANWMERKLTTALDVFGLTHEEFRLLVTLYRNGPMTRRDATEKLGRIRRAVHETIRHAEEFGWVIVTERQLPPAEMRESRIPKRHRGKPRAGLRVGVVSLTPEGERLIGKVLPKQEAAVKWLMNELDSRELESLSRICRKVRRGDVLPFWFEVMRQNREYEESGGEAGESEEV